MGAVSILHTVFGVFGDATGLFLFLAPTITFKRILKNKSTEEFSGIPYPMTLLNCLLSAWYFLNREIQNRPRESLKIKLWSRFSGAGYGLPFISENNTLVTVINGTGAVIEAVYVLIFLMYAPKKEKAKVFGLAVFVLAAFSTIAVISVAALHGKTRRYFCGFAAAIFSVIMYGSPLSIMRTVIRTKSVEFMPFFLSLFVFLCGTSWFIFGLLGNDPFVYVCNGFGSVLGALQLILYAIYRNNKGDKGGKPVAAKDGSSGLEMGLNNGNEHLEKGKSMASPAGNNEL